MTRKKGKQKTVLTGARVKIDLLDKALEINDCKSDIINEGLRLFVDRYCKK